MRTCLNSDKAMKEINQQTIIRKPEIGGLRTGFKKNMGKYIERSGYPFS